MKKKVLLSILLNVFVIGMYAQVKIKDQGVSTETPKTGALLELDSPNKGLLMPRVELSATNSVVPFNANSASIAMSDLLGMTVYNTKSSGSGDTAVTPGIYYNDGSKWVKVGGGSTSAEIPWFYMPSIPIPVSYTSDTDRTKTINLYEEYKRQMNTSGTNSRIKSSDTANNPSVLATVPTSDKFIYYVTDFDPDLFDATSISITSAGVLTYTIKSGAVATDKSFMNIVFVTK